MRFSLKLTMAIVLFCILVASFVFGEPKQQPTVYIVSAPATQVQVVQDASDTVRNPYAPPVRHNKEQEYTQLGYVESGPTKHPFFGKRACRDKWYYYTLVDGLKLPVEYNRKRCSVAPGCDRISDRDTVTVDGRNYTVHIYESNQYEYNPFIEPL
jgi:hypothetical protein